MCRFFKYINSLMLAIAATGILTTLTAQVKKQHLSGIISSAHPLATNAGIEILKKGGNAYDAAIAIAAALNVVEPMNSGLGGYGTILIYNARKKEIRFLNCSGRIPENTNADLMRAPTPGYLQNRTGAKAVSTPGNLHAWEAMHNDYGSLPWKNLFNPAISLAEKGFPVSNKLASAIKLFYSNFSLYTQSFYGNNGIPLKENDILIQKDLAATYKQIASNGAGSFYNGNIAAIIDRTMQEQNGFLSFYDLKNDKAEWWAPVKYNYKGYEVYTASPPSNAFAGLVGLGLMQQFDSLKLLNTSPEYYHLIAEICKLSYTIRLQFSGDPELMKVPVDSVLSNPFLSATAARVNLSTASAFSQSLTSSTGNNTTHFVVIDKWGNIVCATQTLGEWFGSKIMPNGTGVWLNNSLAYCTYEPKGNPMDAFPGHHKLSGDCPVIILKDGLPWAAVGTPGGHTITQNMQQIIFNLIDNGMDMQNAIDAPKVSFAEPDKLLVDNSMPENIVQHLTSKGHNIVRTNIGNAHGVKIIRNKTGVISGFQGGSDKRGEGTVYVLQPL